MTSAESTPAAARAALDKLVREAREEGMREAFRLLAHDGAATMSAQRCGYACGHHPMCHCTRKGCRCHAFHDDARCQARLATELNDAHAQNARFRAALEQIAKQGKVCDEYDVCEHAACDSSCHSALLATEALASEATVAPNVTVETGAAPDSGGNQRSDFDPNVSERGAGCASLSNASRTQWPPIVVRGVVHYVRRGAVFRKTSGHPSGYEVIVSHFRTLPGADSEECVCVGIDANGEFAVYHFAPWQFAGPMAQLELVR